MEPGERVQRSITLMYLVSWAAWRGFDLAIFIIVNFYLVQAIIKAYPDEKVKPKNIHYYCLVLLGTVFIAVSEFIWIRYFIVEFKS